MVEEFICKVSVNIFLLRLNIVLSSDDFSNNLWSENIVGNQHIVEAEWSIRVTPVPSLVTTETDVLQVTTIREETSKSVLWVSSANTPLILHFTIEIDSQAFFCEDSSVVVPFIVCQPVLNKVVCRVISFPSTLVVNVVLAFHIVCTSEVSPSIAVDLCQTTTLESEHWERIISTTCVVSVSREEWSVRISLWSLAISIYPECDREFLRNCALSKNGVRESHVVCTYCSTYILEYLTEVRSLVINNSTSTHDVHVLVSILEVISPCVRNWFWFWSSNLSDSPKDVVTIVLICIARSTCRKFSVVSTNVVVSIAWLENLVEAVTSISNCPFVLVFSCCTHGPVV